MTSVRERCRRLADDARSIRDDVEFRAGLTHCRGELTMTHVDLASAQLAVTRAKEAIDRIVADADRYRQEAAA